MPRVATAAAGMQPSGAAETACSPWSPGVFFFQQGQLLGHCNRRLWLPIAPKTGSPGLRGFSEFTGAALQQVGMRPGRTPNSSDRQCLSATASLQFMKCTT